ncbi:MAG: hypothetical protein E6Q97_37550 [Desulfurellales bacterium]|nr:MAG: hypothetical protein E6Q97_37550 [Desulfurellales bacterium]
MPKIRRKKTDAVQRIICALSPKYRHMWTTWNGQIFCPDGVADPYSTTWHTIIEHELVHVAQQKRVGWWLFLLLYVALPLPIGFAYFRVKFECEAYCVQIADGEMGRDDVIETIATHYAWPMPRKLIGAILDREIQKIAG